MKNLPPAWMETKTYTVKEVAAGIGRSDKVVRRLIKAGKVKVLPVGRPYLIAAAEVRRLIGVEVSA